MTIRPQHAGVVDRGPLAVPAVCPDLVVMLRTAVRAAIDDLKPRTATETPDARFERMLLRFTLAVGPVRGRFDDLIAADPGGPLSEALTRLTAAFASAAEGDLDGTRTALISALGFAFRVVDEGEPDAVSADEPYWLFSL